MAKTARLGRKRLRQPDTFVSTVGTMVDAVAPYRAWVLLGLALAIAGGGAVAAAHVKRARKLARINSALTEIGQSYDTAQEEQLTGKATNWADIEGQLNKLYDSSRGTALHIPVMMYLFNVFLEQRKFDAALGILDEIRQQAAGNPKVIAYVLYETGKVFELKGDRQSAANYFNQAGDLVPNPLGSFLEDENKQLQGPQLDPNVVRAFVPAVTSPAAPRAPTTPGQIVIRPGEGLH